MLVTTTGRTVSVPPKNGRLLGTPPGADRKATGLAQTSLSPCAVPTGGSPFSVSTVGFLGGNPDDDQWVLVPLKKLLHGLSTATGLRTRTGPTSAARTRAAMSHTMSSIGALVTRVGVLRLPGLHFSFWSLDYWTAHGHRVCANGKAVGSIYEDVRSDHQAFVVWRKRMVRLGPRGSASPDSSCRLPHHSLLHGHARRQALWV